MRELFLSGYCFIFIIFETAHVLLNFVYTFNHTLDCLQIDFLFRAHIPLQLVQFGCHLS